MHHNSSLVQPTRAGGDWLWADPSFCNYTGGTARDGDGGRARDRDRASHPRAHFQCYFNEGATCDITAEEEAAMLRDKETRASFEDYSFTPSSCATYVTDMDGRARFRAASMEYLFSNVSGALVALADRAAGEVLVTERGGPVPRDQLITVHVR
jgi:hypothetical protein